QPLAVDLLLPDKPRTHRPQGASRRAKGEDGSPLLCPGPWNRRLRHPHFFTPDRAQRRPSRTADCDRPDYPHRSALLYPASQKRGRGGIIAEFFPATVKELLI